MTLCIYSQSHFLFLLIILLVPVSTYNSSMKRINRGIFRKIVLLCFVLVGFLIHDHVVAYAPSIISGVDTDPYSLINEINALRLARGLAAYSANPILMSVAQSHARYMSVAGVSHIGSGGSSPWQRGLAAGYPLAGDLSLGGFYSENITAGSNKSVQDAVESWQADAPHLTTMLSPDLTEIGVGVVLVGDYVYYVIDCARPSNSRKPQELTPSGGTSPAVGATEAVPIPIKILVPSTPLADGKVIHIVKPGETLWLIAISYKVKIIDLRKWNNLTDTEDIYPGNKLFIKISDMSPTMTVQATTTFSPTTVPSRTREITPTITLTSAAFRTPAASSKFQLKPDFWVLVVIVGAALILAYVLVKAGITDK